MRARSRAPSAVMKSAPKRCAIAAIAAPPLAVVAREIASASMAAAPKACSIASTVLLPLPMPPVRPMRVAMGRRLAHAEGEGEGQQEGHGRGTEGQRQQAGAREV